MTARNDDPFDRWDAASYTPVDLELVQRILAATGSPKPDAVRVVLHANNTFTSD